METRADFLNSIADKILTIKKTGPVLIGIDGVDGSGKTYFAKELVKVLDKTGRSILHSSVDHFHNPSDVRKPKNKELSLSFFEDSFNYGKLKEKLLDPLKYQTASKVFLKHFDHAVDSEVDEEPIEYKRDSILVFDGIFSHRDEIYEYWDYSIFLDVNFETTFRRMAQRDGTPSSYLDEKNSRYYKGQLTYFERCNPKKRASLIIDNNDFENPKIVSLHQKVPG